TNHYCVVEIAPEEFHGVEIRRVGWKPDEVAARVSDQPLADEGVLSGLPSISPPGPAHSRASPSSTGSTAGRSPRAWCRMVRVGGHRIAVSLGERPAATAQLGRPEPVTRDMSRCVTFWRSRI